MEFYVLLSIRFIVTEKDPMIAMEEAVAKHLETSAEQKQRRKGGRPPHENPYTHKVIFLFYFLLTERIRLG